MALAVGLDRLARGARRTLALSRPDQVILLRALVALGVVEIGLRALDLPRVARLLGVRVGRAGRAPGDRRPALDEVARTVRWVDALLRQQKPEGRCLRRSLVLGALMRRYDPVLRIGVSRRSGRVSAHAWIEIAGASLPDMPDADPGAFAVLR